MSTVATHATREKPAKCFLGLPSNGRDHYCLSPAECFSLAQGKEIRSHCWVAPNISLSSLLFPSLPFPRQKQTTQTMRRWKSRAVAGVSTLGSWPWSPTSPEQPQPTQWVMSSVWVRLNALRLLHLKHFSVDKLVQHLTVMFSYLLLMHNLMQKNSFCWFCSWVFLLLLVIAIAQCFSLFSSLQF